jgi:DNA-binding transcriptional ArsR family regulator
VPDPGPVFSALADPTRRAVLRAVAGRGTATATELTSEIDVTRQAVAKHLRILEDAGLVAPERSGREQRYRVTPAPFTDALAWMADVGAAWDARLERLAARTAHRA